MYMYMYMYICMCTIYVHVNENAYNVHVHVHVYLHVYLSHSHALLIQFLEGGVSDLGQLDCVLGQLNTGQKKRNNITQQVLHACIHVHCTCICMWHVHVHVYVPLIHYSMFFSLYRYTSSLLVVDGGCVVDVVVVLCEPF